MHRMEKTCGWKRENSSFRKRTNICQTHAASTVNVRVQFAMKWIALIFQSTKLQKFEINNQSLSRRVVLRAHKMIFRFQIRRALIDFRQGGKWRSTKTHRYLRKARNSLENEQRVGTHSARSQKPPQLTEKKNRLLSHSSPSIFFFLSSF